MCPAQFQPTFGGVCVCFPNYMKKTGHIESLVLVWQCVTLKNDLSFAVVLKLLEYEVARCLLIYHSPKYENMILSTSSREEKD